MPWQRKSLLIPILLDQTPSWHPEAYHSQPTTNCTSLHLQERSLEEHAMVSDAVCSEYNGPPRLSREADGSA